MTSEHGEGVREHKTGIRVYVIDTRYDILEANMKDMGVGYGHDILGEIW